MNSIFVQRPSIRFVVNLAHVWAIFSSSSPFCLPWNLFILHWTATSVHSALKRWKLGDSIIKKRSLNICLRIAGLHKETQSEFLFACAILTDLIPIPRLVERIRDWNRRTLCMVSFLCICNFSFNRLYSFKSWHLTYTYNCLWGYFRISATKSKQRICWGK